jgi:hypothetical protein
MNIEMPDATIPAARRACIKGLDTGLLRMMVYIMATPVHITFTARKINNRLEYVQYLVAHSGSNCKP